MAAKYPAQAYILNPQTDEAEASDTRFAQAADYNKHDEEIKAITDDLRLAIAVEGKNNMKDTIQSLRDAIDAI